MTDIATKILLLIFGVCRSGLSFLLVWVIVKKIGIETYGVIAFGATYMMLGTLLEAFLYPTIRSKIIKVSLKKNDENADILNICATLNTVFVVIAVVIGFCGFLMFMFGDQFKSIGFVVGVTSIVITLINSGVAYIENYYISKKRIVSYKFFEIMFVAASVLTAWYNEDSIRNVFFCTLLVYGSGPIFKQFLAFKLAVTKKSELEPVATLMFLKKNINSSVNFGFANISAVIAAAIPNVYISVVIGPGGFGVYSLMQKTLGMPFNFITMTFPAVWRKYSVALEKNTLAEAKRDYQLTIIIFIVASIFLTPFAIIVMQAITEKLMVDDIEVVLAIVFIFLSLAQLLLSWSSAICNVFEIFLEQRVAYMGLAFYILVSSSVAFVIDANIVLYIVLICMCYCLSFFRLNISVNNFMQKARV